MITAADVIEFDLDGKPVDPKAPRAFLERYIHAAIYKARPDVNAVVHSHAPSVLPFSVTGTPLRPVSHMGSFLGGPVPVFEIRDAGGEATNMLVINQELGAAVAKSLGQSSVVLMRGHGFNAVGKSVKQVVFRSIYTDINARVLAEAIKMGNITYLNDQEAAKAAATLDGLIERSWEIWRYKALANSPKL
jgi:HCOMODA/2-hydroxy-3-carboxy-muconic semialdehyde decarboxylase